MKPLCLLLTLGLSFCLLTPAWARLGETESALIERYGKPNYKMARTCGDEEGFSMSGFSIKVTLINGVSVGEHYRIDIGKHITDDMQVELLAANGEGYSWDELPSSDFPKVTNPRITHMWRRPNGSTAVQTESTIEFKSINLIHAEEEAEHQKPVVPSTTGF